MIRRVALSVAVAMACCICSCTKPSVPHESADFKSVPLKGWAYGDTLEFVPQLADSVGKARLVVAVRHADAYLYSNLWLELSTPVSGVDSMAVDTLNIALADVYGKWYGRGVGVSYVKVDTLGGVYGYDVSRPAKLRHIMRIDTVADLEQIGLIFLPMDRMSDAETH